MLKNLLTFAVTMIITTAAYAQNNGPPPGECGGGLCGTPNQSGGGGCGCGCGCSILIAFTDQGDTYQYADDFDDDGIEDDFDNCPFTFNPTQPDADGDGSGDDCDNCPTTANAGLSDVDADGEGDACDVDADNDDILNDVDNCKTVPNSAQTNHDTDAFGDACDDNDDGDNCPDALDNCPLIGAADCVDDGAIHTSECFPDEDADAVEDAHDNCPGVPNLDQADADGDGIGDFCDPDLDQDGIANLFDNCPQLPNDGISDIDRDGRGDACDPFLCYVITDEATCLDPAASFAVHAGKTIKTQTGDNVLLHLFANRESRAIKYTWTVVKSPDSTDQYTITNPVGSVSVSQSVEYIYETGREPKFSAKVPGEYTLELTAELVHPEDDAYDVKTAKSQVNINVGGETLGGCSSTGSTGAVPAMGLIGLLALVRRRKP
jgi:uncharacterized protein (TIGR03382 family)